MRAWLLGLGALAALGALMSRRAEAAELPPAKLATDDQGKSVRRGIRNNNPGNLRPGDRWQGLASPPVDDANYLRFVDAVSGIRALTINLLNQTRKHGLDTVREIITKWAPLEENPAQAAYIANVARAIGYGPDVHLDLQHDRATLEHFVAAVIRQENGIQPYSDEVIDAGVSAGLEAVHS